MYYSRGTGLLGVSGMMPFRLAQPRFILDLPKRAQDFVGGEEAKLGE